jgi:hypothetical protein
LRSRGAARRATARGALRRPGEPLVRQRAAPQGLRVEHIAVLGDPHYWYEGSNARVWWFLRAQRRLS